MTRYNSFNESHFGAHMDALTDDHCSGREETEPDIYEVMVADFSGRMVPSGNYKSRKTNLFVSEKEFQQQERGW